uniref:Uncharacterized protein n=1 Tax=Tetraselmis sp. GSL018 TaxID=582737 RepID=A0A061RZR2_9CHLO|eukprot:CAMPEP_0177611704 /NCGR_PEP_ID=MMETSP0419_2-20121207/20684_1 /TAXON_ID=582737 /ORGANISM="Tetraselmis sp., Strain GSL018" /LENGTH=192 /DNA_ID=CAMNT_0019107553 /DNA_START=117 /DNA_END=695 /DNA_ORIENTATION=-
MASSFSEFRLMSDTRRAVQKLRRSGKLQADQAEFLLRLLAAEEQRQFPTRVGSDRQALPAAQHFAKILRKELGKKDLANARLVCRDWARHLDEGHEVLGMRLDTLHLSAMCGAHIGTRFPALKELRLDARPVKGRCCKRLSEFLAPLSKMQKLRKLHFQVDEISDLVLEALSCLNNLEDLVLETYSQGHVSI